METAANIRIKNLILKTPANYTQFQLSVEEELIAGERETGQRTEIRERETEREREIEGRERDRRERGRWDTG